MDYVRLGATGLEVSPLCLGTWRFGQESGDVVETDRDDAHEVLDAWADHGGNFIDTANGYGGGDSERWIGEWLAERDREDYVLASKCYWSEVSRFQENTSRKNVRAEVEGSLDRLDTDYLDVLYLHRWDDGTPIEETLSALDTLIADGTVRYVGASTMPAWKFSKALYEADLENAERFVSMQCEYNLVDRHEEVNVLPLCADQGIGVLPWSPLAGGFLTGKYSRDDDPDEGRAATDEFMQKRFTEENWTVLEVVRELANAKDVTPAQLSLAWLLHTDVVDAPIVGPRTVEHLEESVGALAVELTDDEIERLEAPLTPVWNPEIGDV